MMVQLEVSFGNTQWPFLLGIIGLQSSISACRTPNSEWRRVNGQETSGKTHIIFSTFLLLLCDSEFSDEILGFLARNSRRRATVGDHLPFWRRIPNRLRIWSHSQCPKFGFSSPTCNLFVVNY